MNLKSVIYNTMLRRGVILPLLGVLFLSVIATSCESIYDDQSECPRGVSLRFVYEYHMERGANAFPANVDCITVYVFDREGNYVAQFSETSEVLRNENYRMTLPLDAGDYDLLVYGGLACDKRRFEISPVASAKRNDVTVTLPHSADGMSDKQLHDTENRTGGLFYGALSVALLDDGYQEETVYMMKDTNNIQVILQEIDSPYTVNYTDYEYKIIDDNFVLDSANRVIETATEDYHPYYEPYAAENRIMGYVEYVNQNGTLLHSDEGKPVQVACAEFSTSRLVIEHLATAHLLVTDKSGKEIIDLPLIKYLTGIRGFGDSWIKSDQEFLDRQSRWTLMFFLQSGAWINVRIAVNDWTVRFNEASLD